MRNWLRNLAYAAWLVAALLVIVNQLNRPAQAQLSGQTIVAGDNSVAYTSSGDVYRISFSTPGPLSSTYIGNVFGSATSVTPSTWGEVKTKGGR